VLIGDKDDGLVLFNGFKRSIYFKVVGIAVVDRVVDEYGLLLLLILLVNDNVLVTSIELLVVSCKVLLATFFFSNDINCSPMLLPLSDVLFSNALSVVDKLLLGT